MRNVSGDFANAERSGDGACFKNTSNNCVIVFKILVLKILAIIKTLTGHVKLKTLALCKLAQ